MEYFIIILMARALIFNSGNCKLNVGLIGVITTECNEKKRRADIKSAGVYSRNKWFFLLFNNKPDFDITCISIINRHKLQMTATIYIEILIVI